MFPCPLLLLRAPFGAAKRTWNCRARYPPSRFLYLAATCRPRFLPHSRLSPCLNTSATTSTVYSSNASHSFSLIGNKRKCWNTHKFSPVSHLWWEGLMRNIKTEEQRLFPSSQIQPCQRHSSSRALVSVDSGYPVPLLMSPASHTAP